MSTRNVISQIQSLQVRHFFLRGTNGGKCQGIFRSFSKWFDGISTSSLFVLLVGTSESLSQRDQIHSRTDHSNPHAQSARSKVDDDPVSRTLIEICSFSRNQLTFIPSGLCKLPNLEVLILNNNKLLSLPEEIGQLERLIELVTSHLDRQRDLSAFSRMFIPMISLSYLLN